MSSILGVETLQHTNGTTAANVNTDGIITYPQKIVWYANNKDTASDAYGVGGYSKHAYTEVIVNHGNAYDGSLSRFTAPVAGTYFVTYSMHFRGSGFRQSKLYKNGSDMANYARQLYSQSQDSVDESTLTANLYIDLAVNDYLEVFYQVNSGDIYYYDLSHFGGHFIG